MNDYKRLTEFLKWCKSENIETPSTYNFASFLLKVDHLCSLNVEDFNEFVSWSYYFKKSTQEKLKLIDTKTPLTEYEKNYLQITNLSDIVTKGLSKKLDAQIVKLLLNWDHGIDPESKVVDKKFSNIVYELDFAKLVKNLQKEIPQKN